MAGVRFLDAQTCPWTQVLHTSSLSSTPGIRWFRIGVVLLLDWLPTKAQTAEGCVVAQKEPFFPNFEANVRRLNLSTIGPHDSL